MTRDLAKYNKILERIAERIKVFAKDYVPKLYWELREQDYEIQEARDKVMNDGLELGWKEDTIRKWLPNPDAQKSAAGKKGGDNRHKGTATRSANGIKEIIYDIFLPEDAVNEILNASFRSVDRGVVLHIQYPKYNFRGADPHELKPKPIAPEPITPKQESSAPVRF